MRLYKSRLRAIIMFIAFANETAKPLYTLPAHAFARVKYAEKIWITLPCSGRVYDQVSQKHPLAQSASGIQNRDLEKRALTPFPLSLISLSNSKAVFDPYSACNARIGSSAAACRAGYQPKPTPVTMQMLTDRMMAISDQPEGQPANC